MNSHARVAEYRLAVVVKDGYAWNPFVEEHQSYSVYVFEIS